MPDTCGKLLGPSRWKKPRGNSEEILQLQCTGLVYHTVQSMSQGGKLSWVEVMQNTVELGFWKGSLSGFS